MSGDVVSLPPNDQWLRDLVLQIVSAGGEGEECAAWIVADMKARDLLIHQVTPTWDELPVADRPIVAELCQRMKLAYGELAFEMVLNVILLQLDRWRELGSPDPNENRPPGTVVNLSGK